MVRLESFDGQPIKASADYTLTDADVEHLVKAGSARPAPNLFWFWDVFEEPAPSLLAPIPWWKRWYVRWQLRRFLY